MEINIAEEWIGLMRSKEGGMDWRFENTDSKAVKAGKIECLPNDEKLWLRHGLKTALRASGLAPEQQVTAIRINDCVFFIAANAPFARLN